MDGRGDPRCDYCHGAGGLYRNGRWHPCQCVRLTDGRRESQRLLNGLGARHPKRDAVQRELARRERWRREHGYDN